MGYSFVAFLHYFPYFVREMTLSRVFALYESYKMVDGFCDHIPDIGMFKNSSSFLFSKGVNIFESNLLYKYMDLIDLRVISLTNGRRGLFMERVRSLSKELRNQEISITKKFFDHT